MSDYIGTAARTMREIRIAWTIHHPDGRTYSGNGLWRPDTERNRAVLVSHVEHDAKACGHRITHRVEERTA